MINNYFLLGQVVTFSVGSYLGTADIPVSISSVFSFPTGGSSLTVVDNTILNREELDTYRFEVIATDPAGTMANATVTITLTDVNDNAPMINNPE